MGDRQFQKFLPAGPRDRQDRRCRRCSKQPDRYRMVCRCSADVAPPGPVPLVATMNTPADATHPAMRANRRPHGTFSPNGVDGRVFQLPPSPLPRQRLIEHQPVALVVVDDRPSFVCVVVGVHDSAAAGFDFINPSTIGLSRIRYCSEMASKLINCVSNGLATLLSATMRCRI